MECIQLARNLGAQYVIVHGETIVEPVAPGTNRAAIEAGTDILAHPGMITEEDAALAASRNVMLEISAKPGHSLCNGHVAKMALKTGAQLIFGSDSHGPGGFCNRSFAEKVLSGAGLDAKQIEQIFNHAADFARHRLLQNEADNAADW